jgi:hypothetical protein
MSRYEVRATIVADVLNAACTLYRKTGKYEIPRALVTATIAARLRDSDRVYSISERSVLTAVRLEMKRRYSMGRLPAIITDE